MSHTCPVCVLDDVYPEWRQATREQLVAWLTAEVADVVAITAEVSKVYMDLTGGLISKPNTAAHHVIAAVEEEFNKDMTDMDEIVSGMEARLAEFDALRVKFPSAWPLIEQMMKDAKEMTE